MITALDHIIIAVKNLDTAAQQWEQLLGREPSWAGEHPDQGTANRLFRFGDFYLELMAAVGVGGHAQQLENHINKNGEGVFGLAFATDDAEACAKYFRQNGIDPVRVQEGSGRSEVGAERLWRLAIPDALATNGLFIFAIEHLSPRDALPIVQPQAAAVENLDHLVIMTRDAAAIKTLLGEKMGIRLALDQNVPKWHARQLFFRLNRMTIEVVQPEKQSPRANPHGFWGLAWQVSDIAATHDRLAAGNAFNVSEVRAGRKKGTRVFTVHDAPNKIPTLIIQHE